VLIEGGEIPRVGPGACGPVPWSSLLVVPVGRLPLLLASPRCFPLGRFEEDVDGDFWDADNASAPRGPSVELKTAPDSVASLLLLLERLDDALRGPAPEALLLESR